MWSTSCHTFYLYQSPASHNSDSTMATSKDICFSVGILIVSTSASKDPSTDSSGKLLRDFFHDRNTSHSDQHGWDVVELRIVSDKTDLIQMAVKEWVDERELNLVVTSGGTGFAVTDCTPEVCSIHRVG
jgi:molybdopterin biosynthesis enzyme MoaB